MFKHPFKSLGPIIGITGSIGAGKSVVSSFLTEHGYHVINFDEVAKDIREIPEVKSQLIKEFGTSDAKELRKVIGGDLKQSYRLSQLVALPALQETFKRTNELFQNGAKMVFWEAALLIDTGTFASLSGVILVLAGEKTRTDRVVLRDQVDIGYIKPILDQQMPDVEKIKKLKLHPHHLILENNGTLSEFQMKLLALEPWLEQFKKVSK